MVSVTRRQPTGRGELELELERKRKRKWGQSGAETVAGSGAWHWAPLDWRCGLHTLGEHDKKWHFYNGRKCPSTTAR